MIAAVHRGLRFCSVVWIRIYSGWHAAQLRRCGRRFRIRPGSVVLAPENIQVGDNFSSMGTLYLYGNDGEIVIGDNVSINTNVQIGASGSRIGIGNNVLIGPNVVIRSANHGIEADRLIRNQPSAGAEIVIEDDVWIGSNAVITAGVILRHGTVVAAGAVVTKSTEANSIVGGVPARMISRRLPRSADVRS